MERRKETVSDVNALQGSQKKKIGELMSLHRGEAPPPLGIHTSGILTFPGDKEFGSVWRVGNLTDVRITSHKIDQTYLKFA